MNTETLHDCPGDWREVRELLRGDSTRAKSRSSIIKPVVCRAPRRRRSPPRRSRSLPVITAVDSDCISSVSLVTTARPTDCHIQWIHSALRNKQTFTEPLRLVRNDHRTRWRSWQTKHSTRASRSMRGNRRRLPTTQIDPVIDVQIHCRLPPPLRIHFHVHYC